MADFLSFQVTNSPAPTLRFSFQPDAASYYILEGTTNLSQFAPTRIAFGAEGPVWDYPFSNLALPYMFWRGQCVSIFAPSDSDGDGIDDIFELERPGALNPLNSTDALTISPTNGGLTWLQVYLQIFGRSIPNDEVYSREVSLFNGESLPITDIQEIYSREVSVFNADVPLVASEAISREVSVFNHDNGGSPPLTEILEAYSREVSVFNADVPLVASEAISREVSVFNHDSPAAAYEAISREISILNNIFN